MGSETMGINPNDVMESGNPEPTIDDNSENKSENDNYKENSLFIDNAEPFYPIKETVEDIQAPTLVIHGTTSELGRSHEKFLTNLKRSRGINPPSQGNFTPHQAPEIWADEVRKFLRDPGV